ncbi:MAG: tetratricopeptide repeat protein [Acidobacteriota bacterium]
MSAENRRESAESSRQSAERGRKIKDIFQAALEQSPENRPVFLAEACAGDNDLQAEVESLLLWDVKAADRIDSLEGAIASVAAEANARPAAGEAFDIGAYRVLREIGQGGLGTVYLAERADEQYHQQVAIKVVRRDRIDADLLQRFRQERQILAQLDHPWIARLLDGGTTDDGLPYVVMEHIEGESIDRYCDRHKLSIDARLELFRQVCSAVHYAHQNLVIHRDIKPSNILVTREGTPKLLDFGIAKLLDSDTDDTLAAGSGPDPTRFETLTGLAPLTPHYASPEQFRGEPLTTASDVYSLGILLYRLVSGHSPYQFPSRRSQDFERIICETEPERPSTAILTRHDDPGGPLSRAQICADRESTPEKLRKRLVGDLDNIVLMALRKEPERRYASAEQLAEDLRRHAEQLPVIARPATALYRAGKFAARHRLSLAIAASVLLLLSALVAGYTRLLGQERDRAEVEAATKTAVVDYLTGLFGELDPDHRADSQGLSALELLDLGAEKIRDELTESPAIQAEVMDEIGKVYRDLRDFERAESILQDALTLRQRHFGPRHPDVAESLNTLGEVQYWLARLRGQTDKFEPAARHLRQAAAIYASVLDEHDPATLRNLNNLAVLERRQENYEEAEELFRQLLAKQRSLAEPPILDIATTLHNLGVVLGWLERYEEALEHYDQAIAIKNEHLGEGNQQTAETLASLASLHFRRGEYAAAAEGFAQVRTIFRRLLGDHHIDVARVTFRLAQAHEGEGQPERAAELYRAAIAILEAIDPTNSQLEGWREALAALHLTNPDP